MTLLRDRKAEFEELGVKTFGISRDSAWSHIAWAQALDLGDVALLSDWNGEAVRAFDVAQDLRGMRDVAERSAFLVDREGIIRAAWTYERGQLPNFDELLSAARSLS
jgi:glutaredoxin-dependent peroxiredoxin